MRLEHLPLFFDPISGWSKDDEEAHVENVARSPPAQGWASVLSPDSIPETPSVTTELSLSLTTRDSTLAQPAVVGVCRSRSVRSLHALSLGAPLFLVDAQGHRRLLKASAYVSAGAALSPDAHTAVFAEWLGEHNAESVTLYAVPTDGSSEPRRLTPTSCTLLIYGGPLGGGCLDGTDGPDALVGTKWGDLVIAGSGGDTIRAGDGQNVIQSQWGNDDVRAGSGFDTVWAGAGDDVVRTGGARDLIRPGSGRNRAFAGAGPDIVVSNDGNPG